MMYTMKPLLPYHTHRPQRVYVYPEGIVPGAPISRPPIFGDDPLLPFKRDSQLYKVTVSFFIFLQREQPTWFTSEPSLVHP